MQGVIRKKESKINDLDKEIKHHEQVQQDLYQTRKKETALLASINDLRSRNQENQDQIFDLKRKLKET